jgi:hypothetical protein
MSTNPTTFKARDAWMALLIGRKGISPEAKNAGIAIALSLRLSTGFTDPPGYKALAQGLGISERSAFRRVAELVAAGWLRVEGGGGRARESNFVLLIPESMTETSGFQNGNHDRRDAETMTDVTENHDTCWQILKRAKRAKKESGKKDSLSPRAVWVKKRRMARKNLTCSGPPIHVV